PLCSRLRSYRRPPGRPGRLAGHTGQNRGPGGPRRAGSDTLPPVATTTAVTGAHSGAHTAHPNKTAVGTIIWLASELMFFAGLFAMYFTLRATTPELWHEQTQFLNVPFATVNTLVLVSSSVTCQLGVL